MSRKLFYITPDVFAIIKLFYFLFIRKLFIEQNCLHCNLHQQQNCVAYYTSLYIFTLHNNYNYNDIDKLELERRGKIDKHTSNFSHKHCIRIEYNRKFPDYSKKNIGLLR